MNGLHGIIFSYEQEPGLRELAERVHASIPFGGRYRVIDFMLSSCTPPASPTWAWSCTAITRACWTTSATARPGTWRASTAGCVSCRPSPITSAPQRRVPRQDGGPGRRRSYLRGSGRTTSCSPTATLSSICRSRTCLPPYGERRGHHRRLHGRTAASWTTRPTSRSRATARSDTVWCGRTAPRGHRSLEIYILSKQLLLKLVDECSAQDKLQLPPRRPRGHDQTAEAPKLRLGRLRRPAPLRAGLLRPLAWSCCRPPSAPSSLPPRGPSSPRRTTRRPATSRRARRVKSLVADGCDIEGSVENCILFRGVTVEKGAELANLFSSRARCVARRRDAPLRHHRQICGGPARAHAHGA